MLKGTTASKLPIEVTDGGSGLSTKVKAICHTNRQFTHIKSSLSMQFMKNLLSISKRILTLLQSGFAKTNCMKISIKVF